MSAAPATLDMKSILSDKSNRVVVCCGAGGIGKTTTAAAMALRAAEYGRSVVVLTIDPARRLAPERWESRNWAIRPSASRSPTRCPASSTR